ncbi:hypothetical protein SAY87_030770 [Trapa incisa]|uniref:Uncharacterized protein n=1 Tax=Trapa incisa TaxID=236973 RepID=A0AAN7QMD8_9MYRT|nr:hypothetical protein SAY87_030770 [Trapa incisa]
MHLSCESWHAIRYDSGVLIRWVYKQMNIKLAITRSSFLELQYIHRYLLGIHNSVISGQSLSFIPLSTAKQLRCIMHSLLEKMANPPTFPTSGLLLSIIRP